MSNHTAAGPDGVPTEAFRSDEFRARALSLCNAAVHGAFIEAELTTGYVVPLHKKGDASDAANYRPIVLLPVALKVLNKMILLRVRDGVDDFLLPHQAAYRENRSTLQNILPLHELAERAKKSMSPLYAVFADFSNAFSSVRRDSLYTILRAYGVPEVFVQFVARSYAQIRLHVKFAGVVHPESIVPTVGVLQGDTLAPYLFLLVMDHVLRHLPERLGALYDTVLGGRVAALAYADDVVLLSNTLAHVQELALVFERTANEVGLHLNTQPGKTELMVFHNPSLRVEPSPMVRCVAGVVRYTQTYRYLGWNLGASSCGSGWRDDLARRTRAAWHIVRTHDRIWHSHVRPEVKKRLFRALVVPVLQYAAPSYPCTLTVQRTLHTVCNSLLRYSLGLRIHWDDPGLHTPSMTMYSEFLPLPVTLCHHVLTQWGHWLRAASRARFLPPCVAVLLSHGPKAYKRGLNWPPSRILCAHAGLDTRRTRAEDGLDALHDMPLNKESWRQHCSRCVRACLTTFVERHVLPRSVGGYVVDELIERMLAPHFPTAS
jgi:hypothetical protein